MNAKEISVDATVAVLSKMDGIFHIKRRAMNRTEGTSV